MAQNFGLVRHNQIVLSVEVCFKERLDRQEIWGVGSHKLGISWIAQLKCWWRARVHCFTYSTLLCKFDSPQPCWPVKIDGDTIDMVDTANDVVDLCMLGEK